MKIRLLLLLPALLSAALAHAQTFEPGLLVRANGDTLRGEVENAFWVEAPEFIRFRPAPGSASQLFQPRQLRAVSFAGGRYFRYEALPIDHAAQVKLDRLPHGYTADVRTDSVLAEVLLEGPAGLLRTAREGITYYFVRRTGQPYLSLSARKYLRTTEAGRAEIVDANNYRSQLQAYFGDCPAAYAAAGQAPFTAPGMAGVVQAYNDACAPAGALRRSWLIQAAPRRRVALQGGVVAGLRYNSFRNGTALVPETVPCTDCRPRPFAGLYAELLRPGRTSAFYGELNVSRFSNQAWAYYQVNSFVSYYVANYEAWLASARLGVRFFFPLPHERQWLLSLAYELNKTVHPTITALSGSPVEVPNDQLGYVLPTLLPSLGLSWRTQRYTLSLDGQLYTDRESTGLYSYFVGTNFVARASLACRLGRHPDQVHSAASRPR